MNLPDVSAACSSPQQIFFVVLAKITMEYPTISLALLAVMLPGVLGYFVSLPILQVLSSRQL